ncbi:MAG: iron ABC transporter permease [Hyphomicrobiales bacterium]|nr:iron ABC transporter permease [Hyphomicrobiales bacterium]
MGALRDPRGFSFEPFRAVLGATTIITNTLVVGTGTTILAVAAGGLLALMLSRVNTPGRALLSQLVTVPLYITPLLTAIAWSWLGSPKSGLINLFARDLFGISRLVDLQTAGGVIFVAALAYVPLPFLLIGAAHKSMDPALEESARVHGASSWGALQRVTLPLMLPAIMGSALLVFVQAMGLFSVPAVLGMPRGFNVAGTQIYRLLNNYPPRIGEAAAWGVILLVMTAVLVALQRMLLSRRSYVTVTGKAFRPRILELGPVRYLLAALVWAYVAAAVMLPVATLLWAALVNFITIDPGLMKFDLRHFHYVLFEYPKTYLALKNSLMLGAASATAACLIGLGVSWVIVRTRSALRGYLDQISMFPLAMPSMVLALGLLWTWVNVRMLPIYGTVGILLLAYVTHYLPLGARSGSAALRQLHTELEDAARVSGAGWTKTMRWIVLPLTRPTLIATWTLIFILAMQEVSSSILLYTSRSTVLAVAVFDLWEAGNVNALAALAVLQLGVTFVALMLLFRMNAREAVT